MPRSRRRPGLAKTTAQRLVAKRRVELWQATDYRWRELFENADVMSEGATRSEGGRLVYYGTTSVLLAKVSSGGGVPDEQAAEVARMVRVDPHARLRAVRVACLEAQVRSDGPIGRIRADLMVRLDTSGVRIDIELEADVSEADSRAVKRRISGRKRR